jgi:hypothetical protein
LGERRCAVRPLAELRAILHFAYGAQPEEAVKRCHRGLQRVAAALEADDLARAGVEAVMLRLPGVSVEGMAKLAAIADFEKGGTSWEDQPRVPAGQPGGGEWTSEGGGGGGASAQSRPLPVPGARVPREDADGSNEITATSAASQSGTELPNGFYRNSRGGGVLYIPSVTNGQTIRPTEVHALDADAFQVGWTDSTITLRDKEGHLYATSVSPDDLAQFNATTGKILGVSIYAFPGETVGHPDAPPTAQEERELAEESARLQAGRLASEQSLSGRATTVLVGISAGLLLVPAIVDAAAVLPGVVEAAPKLWLNTPEGNPVPTGIRLARLVGRRGEWSVGIKGPKVGIRIPGTNQLRFPDRLDEAVKVLTEVKNVKMVRFTPQIRDYLTYARAKAYQIELWTRPSSDFAKEIEDAILRGDIKPKHIPGED